MQYRRDIDGLRAIAVGGVVLYHAFPDVLRGGFVGVDVFFVISGYLITSIIVRDAENGMFSLAGFYERRFRRILPALFTVLAASTVAALYLLPPSELRDYGKSLVGVSLFVSNIQFWQDTGYFDGPALDKPLLHTWSLAVEEQFYILWPLIVAATIALGRRRLLKAFIALVVVVSLVASEVMVRASPSSAFYLLPFRAWELGFGAMLAIGIVPAIIAKAHREFATWIGLVLIVLPMIVYTEDTPFPGLAALPPCLGTLLLIHAGQSGKTSVARLLAWRPVLFTGLISYSFYLWHWPLLVFPAIGLDRPLAPVEAGAAVVAAYGLAALSLRFVEKPFRTSSGKAAARTSVLSWSAVGLAAFVLVGVTGWATHGLRAYASAPVIAAESARNSSNPFRANCHSAPGAETPAPIVQCVSGAHRTRTYDVLLWGDSHADHLMPGLSAMLGKKGISVRQASISGCSPLSLWGSVGKQNKPACVRYHQAVLQEAASQPDLKAVIISLRWYASFVGLATRTTLTGAAREAFLERQIEGLVRHLVHDTRAKAGSDVKIILVGSTPEFDFWPATCFARGLKLATNVDHCASGVSRDAYWSGHADRILLNLREPGVAIILPRRIFCHGTICRTAIGNDILFRDDDHLTNAGSLLVGRTIASSIPIIS